MPLIVPALRVLFVFLNVFETFKALKLPPPSARNGGQPSIRAMSIRKRAMKGCVTVWLVWCCFALYEKTLDGIVCLFIPFYNELKSIVILFFLLTRARGAEPIFLHVLRPLIKPYVSTLDAALDITHSFGDFLILLSSVPVVFIMSRYHCWTSPSEVNPSLGPNGESASVVSEHARGSSRIRSNSNTNGEPSGLASTESIHGTVRTRRRALEAAHSRVGSINKDPSSSATINGRSTTSSTKHEIWHPPPSSYDDPTADTSSGLPTPPEEEPAPPPSIDEWRKYEPFPSAYPPTPLHTTSSLPPSHNSALNEIPEEPGVVEEWRKYEPFPSAYPPTPLPSTSRLPPVDRTASMASLDGIPEETGTLETDEQGFQGSLQWPRELPNPDSAGDLSDDPNAMSGVQRDETSGEDMDVDGDDEAEEEEEEDDFDVTLRTPFRISRRQNVSNATTASAGSISNLSTGLSTTDNGSPLRTRTNSEASTALASDSSSLAGRKRPLPQSEGDDVRARIRKLEEMPDKQATIRGRPGSIPVRTRTRPGVTRGQQSKARASSSSATLEDNDSDASEDEVPPSTIVKKRRIAPSADGQKAGRTKLNAKSSGVRTAVGSVSATVKAAVPPRVSSNPRVASARMSSRMENKLSETDSLDTRSAKSGLDRTSTINKVPPMQNTVTMERRTRSSTRK